MKLSYQWLSQKPRVFKQLTGVTVAQFNQMRQRAQPQWDQHRAQRDTRGRWHKLTVSNWGVFR